MFFVDVCRPETHSGLFPPLPSDPMAWSPFVCEACARPHQDTRKTTETPYWRRFLREDRRSIATRQLFHGRSFSGHLLRC